MPEEPQWKQELRTDFMQNGWKVAMYEFDLDEAMTLVMPHIEAAYQRGLMAGRSQSGYNTRRKPRKEEPCRTETAGAAGSTPASRTGAAGEPLEGSPS